MHLIITKLHTDICDHIPHQVTISDFNLCTNHFVIS